MKGRLSAFVPAGKPLFGFEEILTVSWGGFPFSEILLGQTRLNSSRDPGDLRDVLCSLCRSDKR